MKLQAYGRLEIDVCAPDGKLLERIDCGRNVITNDGLTKLAESLGGVSAGDIATIAIGTANNPEVETDTTLIAQVFQDAIDGLTGFAPGTTRAEMVVKQNEPPGQPVTLREAGLKASDGTLIARKTFPDLPKTNDLIHVYRWEITFTRCP